MVPGTDSYQVPCIVGYKIRQVGVGWTALEIIDLFSFVLKMSNPFLCQNVHCGVAVLTLNPDFEIRSVEKAHSPGF